MALNAYLKLKGQQQGARAAITLVVLLCLLATVCFSQEKNPQEPPLLTFADLQKGDRDDAPFRIEGYVTQTYKCPPCPPGAMCKPCIGDHIMITDDLNEKDPTLVKHLRIFTDKPEQFELKKKFSFVVKVRGTRRKDRAIEEVELIRFAPLETVN